MGVAASLVLAACGTSEVTFGVAGSGGAAPSSSTTSAVGGADVGGGMQGGSAAQGGEGGGSQCGNDRIEGAEACDGDDLGGSTCIDFGYVEASGLACDERCTLDPSGCQSDCGNSQAEPDEECDGDDLGGSTCIDFGYSEPRGLACDACLLDAAECQATCDGSLLEPGESCDGSHLGGADCTLFGYVDPGGLACDDCDFDDDGCTAMCGNQVIEPGEDCDDGNPNPDDGCDECHGEGASCDNAIDVSLGLGSVTLGGSTSGGGDHDGSCGGFGVSDRVYAVVPQNDGVLSAWLTRSGTTFDSVLYARRECADDASEVLCADSWEPPAAFPPGGEVISFPVEADEPVFLVVDGFASGDYELSIDLSLGSCADPVPLPLWPAVAMRAIGSNDGPADATGTLFCGGSAAGEVVYAVTPMFSGSLDASIDASQTNYDAVLSARTTCGNVLSEIACDREPSATSDESLTLSVTGAVVYVLVDGYFGAEGDYQLVLEP
jgi:hypothetical protein